MPKVAQKLATPSILAGRIANRSRNAEMMISNGDFSGAAEEIYLMERSVRQLKKHLPDNADTEDNE